MNNVSNQKYNTCHHKTQTYTQGKHQVYNAHPWVEIETDKSKHSTKDIDVDSTIRLRQTK